MAKQMVEGEIPENARKWMEAAQPWKNDDFFGGWFYEMTVDERIEVAKDMGVEREKR